MNGYDPYAHAAELGIEVIHRPLRTMNGKWYPQHNTIVIREGLRAVIDRSVLAHEIGHALLGHFDDRPKHEMQADRVAAENLISIDELRRVGRWAPHPNIIARELGVSGQLLRVYLNVHNLNDEIA